MLVESLLPLFAFFLIGVVLRRTGLVGAEQATVLLRIVFHVTLPALAFTAVAQAELRRDLALLPVIGFLVNACCMVAAYLYARATRSSRDDAGTMMFGAGMANMVFMFPFIQSALGPAALAQAVILDLGNAVFLATVANSVASRLAHRDTLSIFDALLRLGRSPLLIALVAAIAMNVGDVAVPSSVSAIARPLGQVTVPLTIIALGVAFSVRDLGGMVSVATVLLRMLVGAAVGATFVWLFGLDGTMALVVVASAAAPIGFTSVTLAAIAKLDTNRAAAAVSLSVLAGLVTTTLLLWLGQGWSASSVALETGAAGS